ncbi:MAG: hypothetical protein K2K13_02080 [Clostridiales bacterium]|nr:hypothetical protein [Clostridiales bacterium]
MGTVQKIGKNIFRIALTTAVTLFAALLVGCSEKDVNIVLLRTELSLSVGESRSLLPYVNFSPATSGGTVTLNTDSDCVSIDGTTVVAVKAGAAEVTISAYGKTAVMRINVNYRAVTDFTVATENNIQTASDGEFKTVVLSAKFEGAADPQTAARWRVSDGTEYTGNRFEYTPNGYGVYTVTATVGNIAKSCEIKVYRPTEVTVRHASLDGVTAYSTVTFTAREMVNSLNPRSVYEWRVDDEPMGNTAMFDLVPTSGRHNIALYVNGAQKQIDGKNELTLDVASDTYADCKVEFDDAQGVYVRYANGRKVMYICIIDPEGKRRTFDVTDAQYSHLFTDGRFRATEYITLCAPDPKAYTIIIGMDGDRCEFDFVQLDADAQEYLDNKVFCRNSFISSEGEAEQYVRELFATGAQNARCYVATDVERTMQVITAQAQRLGLNATADASGNVISLNFAQYSNRPERYETASKRTSYAELPHIEYNVENRRANDYVFASDRAAGSISVSGSEQLLIAISNELKPLTQSGDVAHTVYRSAKTALLRIIGKDYTQEKKIHTIYDWLQWFTVNSSVASNSSGRFLEGVFASESTGSGYAVNSEGAAKAFALLCGIEGIECVICYGEGYGYYNKVKLSGLWYNVDVFGGKTMIEGTTGSTGNVWFTSHRGLLITDDDMKRLGCNVNDGYEAFDTVNSRYMQKYDYDGVYMDNYIDKTEAEYEFVRAVVFNAFNAVTVGNTRIPFVGGEVIIYNNTYGVELACAADMTEAEVIEISGFVNRAIDEYASEVLKATFASRRTIIADGVICAVAVSPRAVQSEG